MMKRFVAMVLCVMLAVCALPAFAGGNTYIASTPVVIATQGQLHNVQLAADSLNGWYIPYGDSFSFNDAIGPRTVENGFVEAANGRGVNVVGGGVAQLATTLYLALLQMPGIQYTQITTYGDRFTAGYVSNGSMAVVVDYDAAVDFCFTNLRDDIAIRCWVEGGALYCEISEGAIMDMSGADPKGVLISSACFDIENSSGLVNNITRAADKANGTELSNGDVFSFNGVIGPRTEEYGYVSAINGRGVNVIGGGVAQVASVLWLAVKDMDDMTVTKKSTYGERYNQGYVDSSADAIVTDYKAGTDFAFRYDGEGTVTVYVCMLKTVCCAAIYTTAPMPA